MGPAWTFARRSLLGRPARTALSTLGIARGIAIGVGVVTLDYNTIHGLSPSELAADPDLRVRPARGRDHAADELRATEGVAAAASFFQNDASVRAVPREGAVLSEESTRVRLYGLDASAAAELDAYSLLDGRSLDPARAEREVLLGDALARALGIGPGDHLLVARPRRSAKTACVEGELVKVTPAGAEVPREEAFRVVGILAREGLGHRVRGMVAIVDF